MSVAAGEKLYEVTDLKVHFPIRGTKRVVKALDGVDLEWNRGEVLGIVGESGCGKSTLGRALMGLQEPTGGDIAFLGQPLKSGGMRQLRRRVQMVFQDPYQSLNPRMTVGDLVQEGLAIHKIGKRGEERTALGVAALEGAGLRPATRFWERYPHELSGGQRQRVVIAAALALEPEALVCDEPVSALDVSIRAQVIQLLVELKRERHLGLIFITHDVGLAWALCDRVAVMYLGRVIEQGTTDQVLANPQHPYTKALLSVVPNPVPREPGDRRQVLEGELPDASQVPPGCRFHPRCPVAFDRCHSDDPEALVDVADDPGHLAACWLLDESAPVAAVAPVLEPEPVLEPDLTPEPDPESEPAPETEPEADPAESEPVAEAETVTEPEPAIEPDPAPEPEPKSEPAPETELEADPAESEPVVEVAPTVAAEVIQDAEPRSEPDPDPAP